MCVYCNRSQKTSQRVKGNSHATRLHVRLLWSITVHTLPHTRENVIYLFYTIKIEMIYWSILRAWKKTWADVDLTPSVCHHGQQPTKMHTEVTLLYCIIRAIKCSILYPIFFWLPSISQRENCMVYHKNKILTRHFPKIKWNSEMIALV